MDAGCFESRDWRGETELLICRAIRKGDGKGTSRRGVAVDAVR
jgi:hypothetical protein